MGNLYLMCGIPGSGKSTYAKTNKDLKYCKYISRDDIRYSLLKDEDDYFSKEKQVFRTFIAQIKRSCRIEILSLMLLIFQELLVLKYCVI